MRKKLLACTILAAAIVLNGTAAFGQHHKGAYVEGGTVSGALTIKGLGPMLGGSVFFIDEAEGILPSATRYWLVPTHVVKLNDISQFSVKLPEGTYFVGAIERSSEGILGPPEEGDYFFISRDSKGNPKKLTVWKNSSIDLGTLDEALPFKRSAPETKGITSINGTIADIHGRTIGGMIVAAYHSPEMTGRPVYMSERTALDGKYQLRLARGGTYYLMVRANFDSGEPAADELIGMFKNGKPVKVKTGVSKKGMDIKVWPAQMFGEQ